MSLKPPFDRITIEKEKMGGKPCVRGMRITVRRVVELIGGYRDWDKLLVDYPDLEHEDLRQSIEFAHAHLDGIDVEDRDNGARVTGPLITGSGKLGPAFPEDENPHELVFS